VTLRVALLRAVNVGGRKVAMAELRAMLEAMGFGGVRTLLQSGNAVFESDAKAEALETKLEAAIAQRFGLHSDVMVRTPAEMEAVLEACPFPEAAKADPARLLVMFLKRTPDAAGVEALHDAVAAMPEQVAVKGREAYLVYPQGVGVSKLTNVLAENRLGVRGTARNWNTVGKLAALA
jgi:uncharacterized protein (DUF1697 family)